MQVVVVGAGALGSVYGGYLHAAGLDVTLIDVWDEHVRAITGDGLRIDRGDGEPLVVHPAATTDASTVDHADLVLVLVKSTHTREAMADVAHLLDDDTTVMTVQNGLTNVDTIAERVPRSRIVAGNTLLGPNVVEPGHVRLFDRGVTVLGCEDDERARRVVELLAESGLPAERVDDPLTAIWNKQLLNVTIKPLAALTGLSNGPLGESGDAVALMEELLAEMLAVADAAGITITESDPLGHVLDVCARTGEKQSSMLADVEAGRPTEIDHINGAVVEYGERHGVETPYNRAITLLVRGKESAYLDREPGT